MQKKAIFIFLFSVFISLFWSCSKPVEQFPTITESEFDDLVLQGKVTKIEVHSNRKLIVYTIIEEENDKYKYELPVFLGVRKRVSQHCKDAQLYSCPEIIHKNKREQFNKKSLWLNVMIWGLISLFTLVITVYAIFQVWNLERIESKMKMLWLLIILFVPLGWAIFFAVEFWFKGDDPKTKI